MYFERAVVHIAASVRFAAKGVAPRIIQLDVR
jgi:hypothetical protein